MIKDDGLVPTIRVMTLAAVFTQLTLVNIVMGMTTSALRLKVVINIPAFVTGHTMYFPMAPKKRVIGITIMAKMRFLPTRLLMTVRTLAPVTAFVPVFFFMTGNALRFQLLLIKMAVMTGRTTDLCMAPAQTIFGVLVMVKLYLLPGPLVVTVSALRAKLAAMFIVDLVTADTAAGDLDETAIGMT